MQKLIIEDCLQLVEFFKTLGDFTRLRIVLELKTKRCVGELAEELEMSHSAVSHQLNILKAWYSKKSKTRKIHLLYSAR
ncbi:UNVERIFIED_CONTAM: ArsR family transcriptional regulator [Blautia caecimuris]